MSKQRKSYTAEFSRQTGGYFAITAFQKYHSRLTTNPTTNPEHKVVESQQHCGRLRILLNG